MDTHSKGAGPPGSGGLHGKGCGGRPPPGNSLPTSAPPRQDRPRGFYVAGEILACDLTPAEKLLLGFMATLSGESGEAYAGVDTYASRLGVNPRTVERLLSDLKRRGFLVQVRPGGGREIAAVYRLNPLIPCVGKPRQFAPVSVHANPDKSGEKPRHSVHANPDKSGEKPRHSVHANPDKSGEKPRQFAPQDVEEGRSNSRGEENNPPAPSSRGTQNGDGNGGHQEGSDPDAALEELFGQARRKALTARESALFREAVAEAREAGATDGLIAAKIRGADRGAAAWDRPNLARETAKRLLASYQAATKMTKPRTSIAQILDDLNFARRKLAHTPRPDRGDDGAALWQAQVDWADVYAEELAKATGQPRPAALVSP